MPLYTILLLFFIALALLPLAIRNSSARNTRRERVRDAERMAIRAKICEAAARDAFGVELDHSLESIGQLDAVITNGWGNDVFGTDESNRTKTFESERYDLNFIFASYLGDVFVQHEKAKWQWNDNEAFLYFQNLRRTAMPFELIKQKLSEPSEVDLVVETARWLNPLVPNDRD